MDPAPPGPRRPLDLATRPSDALATDALTDAFIAAVTRRRASGEHVDSAECAAACLARLAEWGAERVILPAEPLLAELGLPEAISRAGIDVITWPTGRDWREL